MLTRILVFLVSLTDEFRSMNGPTFTGPCYGCRKNPCACK